MDRIFVCLLFALTITSTSAALYLAAWSFSELLSEYKMVVGLLVLLFIFAFFVCFFTVPFAAL